MINLNNKLFYLLAGAAVGVLFAPKAGQEMRSDLRKEKSPEVKTQKIKSLEKELKEAISAHVKASPEVGGSEEDRIFSQLSSLENALKIATLKKPSKTECDKAKHQIELEEKGSFEEKPLSAEAQEALAWVQVLCR